MIPTFPALVSALALLMYVAVFVTAGRARSRHNVKAPAVTGAPGNSSEPYPYRNIHKYTEQIFDAFGPERTFWGTDITRMPCSWRQCVAMFTDEMPFLKGRDRELVMGWAVCDWIGWKLPG